MIPRNAMALVCDDFRVEITGKYIIVGMYSGNIAIPAEPFRVNQLAFVFLIESDVSDPMSSLAIEVTLPGEPTQHMKVPLPTELRPEPLEGSTRWIHRVPMVINNPSLRVGPTVAKVIHDKGEIRVGGIPIIVKLQSDAIPSAFMALGPVPEAPQP